MNNYWQLFTHGADHFSHRPAIVVQRLQSLEQFDYRDLRAQAERFAVLLTQMGIGRGHCCAIMGENSPAWCAAYLGILRLAAIAVPIDPSYSPAQVETLLHDADCKALLASASCMTGLTAVQRASGRSLPLVPLDLTAPDCPDTSSLEQLPCPALGDDPAIIIYTSGTTTDPKGVVLTHGNILAALDALRLALPIDERDCTLGALPFCHILGLISGLLLPFTWGGCVVLLEQLSPGEVRRALRERGITAVCGVPLFFHLLHERITREIVQHNVIARIAARLLIVACGLVRKHMGFNLGAVIFRNIHALCGPKMRFFVSGGAMLDREVEQGLYSLGFDVLQGYGLTESAGPATLSPWKRRVLGTVGLPIPGVSVAVLSPSGSCCEPGQEGEIALRGPTLTCGYHRRPDATAAAFRNGWFMTGDLGFFGKDGQLRISGRSKDVIVLDSGKNVYPEEIERHLERSPLVKEVCVVGRRLSGASSEKLFAAVVPDMTALRARRVVNIREYLRNEIDTFCAELPPFKRVAGFEVMREDLPRTTTLKIKRFVVQQQLNRLDHLRHPNSALERSWGAGDRAWADAPAVAKILHMIQARAPANGHGLHPDDSLELDLQFDSLSRIDLIVALEQALGVRLSVNDTSDCYTVRDLAERLLHAVPVRVAQRDRRVNTSLGWQKILDGALAADAADADSGPAPGSGPAVEIPRYVALKLAWLSAKILIRLDARGLENLPGKGAFMLCPNHQSYLDAALLFSCLPYHLVRRTVTLGKTRVFAHPLGGWLADRLNVARVDPDANLVDAMQISARALNQRRVLILFPEGERTLDGDILPLRRGAAVLSCHLQVPIVPVVLDGTHKIWPRGRRIQRLAPVTIRFLPPIFPPSPQPYGDSVRFDEDTVRFTAELQSRMESALAAIRSCAPCS